ncbi:MAG: peptide chain release factor N(5)-glutamine methyltransferase [Pseudomonadota bacterium]
MKNTLPEHWLAAQPAALRIDCQRLLMERFGWTLTDWVTRRRHPLTGRQLSLIEQDAARLAAGEPLAYLLGTAAFRELTLAVNKTVLIPRPETEELIDHVLGRCQRRLAAAPEAPLRIVEAGTGSGAIILALAADLRSNGLLNCTELLATELSGAALTVARGNGAMLDLPVRWVQGDWLKGLAGPFDIIISNPPYLAADDPHLPTLTQEPRAALVAGPSGLEDLAQLIDQGATLLAPGGELWLEHGNQQRDAVRELFELHGFTTIAGYIDSYGNDRFSCGRRPGAA